MAFYFHTIELLEQSTLLNYDRVMVGMQHRIANVAGGSAGATVTTAVTFTGLPAEYTVMITPDQACLFSVTDKTSIGFNVVLTPRDDSTTLSDGHFDVLVVA